MTALIVDDDRKCVELIRQIIGVYCPDIATIHTARTAMDGVKMIQHVNPEIVFLDIMMPHHTGFDLLECFPQATFDVIIVTAGEYHASNFTKIHALLNKPIHCEHLATATQAICTKRKQETRTIPRFIHSRYSFSDHQPHTDTIDSVVSYELPPLAQSNIHISPLELVTLRYSTLVPPCRNTAKCHRVKVKTQQSIHYLRPTEIVRAEADGSYTKLYQADKQELILTNRLNMIDEILCKKRFFRIHKTHIINLEYIKHINNQDSKNCYVILHDNTEIPIARHRKDEFMAVMDLMTTGLMCANV